MLERYRTKAGAPVRVDVGRKVVTIRGCRDQADLERQLERRYGPGVLEDAGQLMRWRQGEAGSGRLVTGKVPRPAIDAPRTTPELEGDAEAMRVPGIEAELRRDADARLRDLEADASDVGRGA